MWVSTKNVLFSWHFTDKTLLSYNYQLDRPLNNACVCDFALFFQLQNKKQKLTDQPNWFVYWTLSVQTSELQPKKQILSVCF